MLKRLFAPKFESFTEQWLVDEYIRHAPKSINKWRRILKRVVYPAIGHKRITSVQYSDIANIIRTYRETAPRSTSKLRQILQRIFVYAEVVYGYYLKNPVTDGIRLLCQSDHGGEFPVLETSAIPEFFRAIDALWVRKAQTKTAFWLLAYTALRRSEVMQADWSEIDFENRLWTIPDVRMKMGRVHTVPMADQVMDLLRLLQKQTERSTGRLFDIHISTPSNLCTIAGYQKQMSLHGLRKVFSTHCNESGLWGPDDIEIQLAHAIGGVRGVYNKAIRLEHRRKLMIWYAGEIDRWRGIPDEPQICTEST